MDRKIGHCSIRCHAFSLVEILIVLVIIGLVLGLVGPALLGKLDESKQNTARSQLILLKNCMKSYYLDMDMYPTALQDLVKNPGNGKWKGPYVEDGEMPNDPWGAPYRYNTPGADGKPYDLYTYGRDNAPGGDGVDMDIHVWKKDEPKK